MTDQVWINLGPPQPPEVAMRESLIASAGQLELLLSYLPRVQGEQQTDVLARLIITAAEAQLLLVRLMLQKYH